MFDDNPNNDLNAVNETWEWAGNLSGSCRLPFGIQFSGFVQSKVGLLDGCEDEVTGGPIKRCAWVGIDDPLMLEYNDREWGVPVHEDRKHFEFLVLEAAQAGLSWSIVLRKRDGYRRAFSQFDPEKVARYNEKRIQKLISDPAIIRNRMKIEAAVRNARAFLAIQEEFGSFNDYCWRFVDGRPRLNRWKATREIPATSHDSDVFSKDLKSRGLSFVGSTIIYAHMQAVGMLNDHLVDCFRYQALSARSP